MNFGGKDVTINKDDTIQSLINKVNSSGGGATLEYIANETLPGIDAIGEEDEIEVLDL